MVSPSVRTSLRALFFFGTLLGAGTLLPSVAPAASTREIVLVSPETADGARCAAWKKEGFVAIALVLDDHSELGGAAEGGRGRGRQLARSVSLG